jgi:hypothetical protein
MSACSSQSISTDPPVYLPSPPRPSLAALGLRHHARHRRHPCAASVPCRPCACASGAVTNCSGAERRKAVSAPAASCRSSARCYRWPWPTAVARLEAPGDHGQLRHFDLGLAEFVLASSWSSWNSRRLRPTAARVACLEARGEGGQLQHFDLVPIEFIIELASLWGPWTSMC